MAESLTTRRGSNAGISGVLGSQVTVTRSSSKSKRGSSHQRRSSLPHTPPISSAEPLGTPPLNTIHERPNGESRDFSGPSGNSYFGNAPRQPWSPGRALRRARSYMNNLTQPATPLLPQEKRHVSSAFGGSRKETGLSKLLHSRWIRFAILFYTSFSVLLTFIHMISWTFQSSETQRVYMDGDWEPKRTYDSGEWFVLEIAYYHIKITNLGIHSDLPYSHLDSMSSRLKFSKIFSSSTLAIDNIQPYYLRATSTPENQDISLITHITVASWPQLERLAENWQG